MDFYQDFALCMIVIQEGLKELKTNLVRAKKGKAPMEGADGKKTRNITPEALNTKTLDPLTYTKT